MKSESLIISYDCSYEGTPKEEVALSVANYDGVKVDIIKVLHGNEAKLLYELLVGK